VVNKINKLQLQGKEFLASRKSEAFPQNGQKYNFKMGWHRINEAMTYINIWTT